MDSSGNFLCISLYNIRAETVDTKITKDALLTIREPLVKHAEFQGFKYHIVQVFDISKMYINQTRLSHEDFNPNVVYN